MSNKRSNGKFIIGFAVAVLLPLSFYLIFSRLSKGKIAMPRHYKVDSIDSIVSGDKKPDTVFHTVSDIRLTNQLGQQVSLSDLKGKMVVIDFFFTTCPSICPVMTANMKRLQNSFRKDTKKEASLDTIVQFVSITVNPGHDSFPELRKYADRFGANHDHWWFLTGDKKTIYDFARHELDVTTGPGDGGAEDFIHTEKFVLLDRNRHIRGYYNGTDPADVSKCADDIVLLTLEKKK